MPYCRIRCSKCWIERGSVSVSSLSCAARSGARSQMLTPRMARSMSITTARAQVAWSGVYWLNGSLRPRRKIARRMPAKTRRSTSTMYHKSNTSMTTTMVATTTRMRSGNSARPERMLRCRRLFPSAPSLGSCILYLIAPLSRPGSGCHAAPTSRCLALARCEERGTTCPQRLVSYLTRRQADTKPYTGLRYTASGVPMAQECRDFLP
jgi:hypothetical protein